MANKDKDESRDGETGRNNHIDPLEDKRRKEEFKKYMNLDEFYSEFFQGLDEMGEHLSDEMRNLADNVRDLFYDNGEEGVIDIENERCKELISNLRGDNFNWSEEYSKFLHEHPDVKNYDEIEDSPSVIDGYGFRKRNAGKIEESIPDEPNALELITDNMINIALEIHKSKSESEKNELKDRFLVLQRGYKTLTGEFYPLKV